MNKFWWCMDCRTAVNLDTHGRCEFCSSDAITLSNPTPVDRDIYELERMYGNQEEQAR